MGASIRSDLPVLPPRMARLPVDHRGYPVPWFVAWIDGAPDHRVQDTAKRGRAAIEERCWVCGERLGRYRAFLIGPMCAVNRVSSEPPSHRECAEYSARACPFMSRPDAVRRVDGLPDGGKEPAGIAIQRNPGVALVWITKSVRIERVRGGDAGSAHVVPGLLWRLGDPTETLWFREGRPATRAEVLDSIESGLALLQLVADEEGPEARAALDEMVTAARALLPPPACDDGR